MRGSKRPLLVEDMCKIDDASGVSVPIPTPLSCAIDSVRLMKHNNIIPITAVIPLFFKIIRKARKDLWCELVVTYVFPQKKCQEQVLTERNAIANENFTFRSDNQ
jgi:hypothetical protein